jgi:hypothetical protein
MSTRVRQLLEAGHLANRSNSDPSLAVLRTQEQGRSVQAAHISQHIHRGAGWDGGNVINR